MNREEFHRFVSKSTGNESNICQIYAYKDGKAVYDDCWHGFTTTDAVNINSVTKGVMALLAGIAIDKGCIQSVDQKVLDFFPDYTVKRGEKTIYDVTVKHLLTMTAPYKFRSEPWKKVCTSQDWTLTVLDFLGGRKGITGEFKYATLGIQILAGVIENATGEKCIDLANRELFAPLGIAEHVIHGDSHSHTKRGYSQLIERADEFEKMILETISRIPSLNGQRLEYWSHFVQEKYARERLHTSYRFSETSQYYKYRSQLKALHAYHLTDNALLYNMRRKLSKLKNRIINR